MADHDDDLVDYDEEEQASFFFGVSKWIFFDAP
jgi:hypothetical protein